MTEADLARIRRRVAIFFFFPLTIGVVFLTQTFVARQTAVAELERAQLEERLRTAPVVENIVGAPIRRGTDDEGAFVDIAFRGVKSRSCQIIVTADEGTGRVRSPPGSVLDEHGLWWGIEDVYPVTPDGKVATMRPRNIPVEVGMERSYGTWRFRAPAAMHGPIRGATMTVSHQCGEFRVETPFGPTYIKPPES